MTAAVGSTSFFFKDKNCIVDETDWQESDSYSLQLSWAEKRLRTHHMSNSAKVRSNSRKPHHVPLLSARTRNTRANWTVEDGKNCRSLSFLFFFPSFFAPFFFFFACVLSVSAKPLQFASLWQDWREFEAARQECLEHQRSPACGCDSFFTTFPMRPWEIAVNRRPPTAPLNQRSFIGGPCSAPVQLRRRWDCAVTTLIPLTRVCSGFVYVKGIRVHSDMNTWIKLFAGVPRYSRVLHSLSL